MHENSPLFKGYVEILRQADPRQPNNWSNTIEFFNKRIQDFKKLQFTLPLFCMQQPSSQNALDLPFGQAFITPCANSSVIQEMFVIKPDGHIMTNENVCLDAAEQFSDNKDSSLARIVICNDSKRQHWIYDLQKQQIIHKASKNCLTAHDDVKNVFNRPIWKIPGLIKGGSKSNENKYNVNISPCTDGKMQKWMLLPLNWI